MNKKSKIKVDSVHEKKCDFCSEYSFLYGKVNKNGVSMTICSKCARCGVELAGLKRYITETIVLQEN